MNAYAKFYTLFNKQVKLEALEYLKVLIKEMVDEAKDIIENQSYNWTPLTEKYLEHKIKQGLDPRTLIATRFYLMHIGWGVSHGKIWWGVPNIIHEPSGLPLPVIARIHEFGTKTIPARPLWRPLLMKYAREAPRFAKRYNDAVKRAAKEARKSSFKSAKRKVKVTM
jgi:hypothetical protein